MASETRWGLICGILVVVGVGGYRGYQRSKPSPSQEPDPTLRAQFIAEGQRIAQEQRERQRLAMHSRQPTAPKAEAALTTTAEQGPPGAEAGEPLLPLSPNEAQQDGLAGDPGIVLTYDRYAKDDGAGFKSWRLQAIDVYAAGERRWDYRPDNDPSYRCHFVYAHASTTESSFDKYLGGKLQLSASISQVGLIVTRKIRNANGVAINTIEQRFSADGRLLFEQGSAPQPNPEVIWAGADECSAGGVVTRFINRDAAGSWLERSKLRDTSVYEQNRRFIIPAGDDRIADRPLQGLLPTAHADLQKAAQDRFYAALPAGIKRDIALPYLVTFSEHGGLASVDLLPGLELLTENKAEVSKPLAAQAEDCIRAGLTGVSTVPRSFAIIVLHTRLP